MMMAIIYYLILVFLKWLFASTSDTAIPTAKLRLLYLLMLTGIVDDDDGMTLQ
jgi:hypothetical protein